MKINLLIVATNKYIQFLPALLASAEKNFLMCDELTYCIFTDKIAEMRPLQVKYGTKINLMRVEHKPWPYATLMRCHFFRDYWYNIGESGDYYFYIDADTLFTDHIKLEDVIGERVGTQHCGFVGRRGSYETNPLSKAYVSPDEGERYYGGGFWGFSKQEFPKFILAATTMIDEDERNGIIPVWHDESVLNRYFIDNPPTKVLNPSYHWPQNRPRLTERWPEQYPCKILLLDKNHLEIRS
jgi:histo-blood group ABO system transferase